MLHMKLTGMKHRTPYKQNSALLHTVDPLMGSNGQNIFLKNVRLHFKLKGSVEHYAIEWFELMHSPDLLGWV